MAAIRFPVGAGAAGLVVAALALAQPPADLTEAQRAVEAEVRLAVRQAETLAQTNPRQAEERLEKLVDRLNADTVLPETRRQALQRMVKDRLRVTQARAESGLAERQALDAARTAAAARRDTEARSAQRLLEAIKKLQKEGKLADASKKARELAGRHPDNPAAQAMKRTTEVANQVAANRSLQQERDRGVTGGLRGVERSALPPAGDIEFPKDWKEKTRNRKPTTTVKMTPREKAILQALDAPISVDFQDSPLDAVLEYLRTIAGVPIVVDPNALAAVDLTYDTKITLRLKDASLRSVLRLILNRRGLAHIVKDEIIQVITLQQAKDLMVTRVHYIGDLLTSWDEFGATLEAAVLIDLIQSTIDPPSWQRNGGPGTIVYHHQTRSLVIKQSAEFHGTLASGLP
jgi:hypothetical protein